MPNITQFLESGSQNYNQLLEGKNILEVLRFSCLRTLNDTLATAITLQNATSWKNEGCLKGFYCPWTDPKYNVSQRFPLDQLLPQQCPPIEACAKGRLAGATCPISMGIFEPMVCPPGSYCKFILCSRDSQARLIKSLAVLRSVTR